MNNKNVPNLAQDLFRIHCAITRGLSISLSRGREFLETGFPDPALRKGYADYVHSLAMVLDAHHLGEDEIAFPYLKEKIPSAPYERLAKHHRQIVALLQSVEPEIARVEKDGDAASLVRLVDGLDKICGIWRPHSQAEEGHFTEAALAKVCSPQEQARLSAALAKHGQEHTPIPSLALPFVLFNLNLEDRAVMAASMPGLVVQELIPKAWKQQWAPMQPFLLE